MISKCKLEILWQQKTTEKKTAYPGATFAVFFVFGILIGLESPGINTGMPTPMIGVWERLNIGAFMQWIVVFACVLL